jgi:hypothetical protein
MMLTTEQLAAHLGVSARQVQRLRGMGLPCVPVGARAVRYDAAACTAWLQANWEHIACRTIETRPAATKSLSASAVDAFTGACRKAQLRVMPSASNPS